MVFGVQVVNLWRFRAFGFIVKWLLALELVRCGREGHCGGGVEVVVIVLAGYLPFFII